MTQREGTFSPATPPGPAQRSTASGALFSQFKELLDAAEAKVSDYDELQSSLQGEKRSVEHLQQALQTQQRQLDSFVTQDFLVAQLMRQLATQSHAMEQMKAKSLQQGHLYTSAQAQATTSQQELGQKRKRVQELEQEDTKKQQKIKQLEQELQDYKGICSYVTTHTQRLEHQLHPRTRHSPSLQQQKQASQTEEHSPAPVEATSQGVSSDSTAAPDSSTAEGAAGLLAMTSTADKPDILQIDAGPRQSSEEPERPHYFLSSNLILTDRDVDGQEPRSDYVSKRASCVIIGRHPHAPREVRVACRQLTGTLLLRDCCAQLQIRAASLSNKLLSPPEFEAAAGCSKGKNWKANIKVLGSNGRNQMLKVWLPGLMQLVGDHSKTAVAKDTDISSLLDAETGLRIQPED